MSFDLVSPEVLAAEVSLVEEGDEMSIAGLKVVPFPKDSTSTKLQAKVVDKRHQAVDVSGGGSVLFFAKTLDDVAVVNGEAAAYTTDGTDGLLEFVTTAALVGTVRQLICEFEVTGLPTGNKVTKRFILDIEDRAKVTP